jgi:hypothetical protein
MIRDDGYVVFFEKHHRNVDSVEICWKHPQIIWLYSLGFMKFKQGVRETTME